MRSKNVLWLGLLFVLLLIVFCVTKYIDKFNPNIKTIQTPQIQKKEDSLELKPIKIANQQERKKVEQNSSEVDEDYLQIIKLVEQEEQDIENAYKKAVKEKSKERQINKNIKNRNHTIKSTKKEQKRVKKRSVKRKKRFYIESILESKTIPLYGELTNYQKRELKRISQTFKNNSSSFIRIESSKRVKKVYKIKKYLSTLKVPLKKVKIIYKNRRKIFIEDRDIEISVIKKD